MNHNHRAIAKHSPSQQAFFFALAADLNYNKDEVKKRASKKFDHECFNDLESTEINWLIDRLQQELEKRQKPRF